MSRCPKLEANARRSPYNLSFADACRLAECAGFVFDRQAEYVATAASFPLLSGVDASPAEAIAELQVAIEAVLESIAESGGEPPQPPRAPSGYSGNLRMPASVHGALAQAADADGVSLNTFIVSRLAHALGLRGEAM